MNYRLALFLVYTTMISFSGMSQTFPPHVGLGTLSGPNGFFVPGVEVGGLYQRCVAAAGDINGDGIQDFVIGEPTAPVGGASRAGEAYIIFGKDVSTNGEFESQLNLNDLDGDSGFKLVGGEDGDNLGISVFSAGDINNDGIDDLLVGAVNADPGGRAGAGRTYLIWGRSGSSGGQAFPPELHLDDIDRGVGVIFNGPTDHSGSGRSVCVLDDMNGDGI